MSQTAGRKFPKSRDPELERRLQERQIVTVRCAYCDWARTGPAFKTSKRGTETGMIYWQSRHRQTCKTLRERERYARDRDKILARARAYKETHREEQRAYFQRYYAEKREAINARRRVRDRARRARARAEREAIA